MDEPNYDDDKYEEDIVEKLQNLESQFTMLQTNFNRELEPEQIETLEQEELQLFEEYYNQKRNLLRKMQEERRQG
jgi:hypothetical protein